MIEKILGVVCVCLVVTSGLFYAQKKTAEGARERLLLLNRSLQSSIVELEANLQQAKEARAVADANAAREKIIADEHRQLRSAIMNGDEDAELPQWFLDDLSNILDRVR